MCESRTSGLGRWAIAVIQSEIANCTNKLVVASVYAPNCHRESKLMFEEFLYNLDLVTEELITQSNEFSIAIAGDFNFVLDHMRGSLNRLSTNTEKSLAAFVKERLLERGLCEITAKDSLSNPFTWRRGACFSKLDYMFVSNVLAANLTKSIATWHEFGANFDHACIEGSFAFTKVSDRGRSFPKLFSTDVAVEKDRIWIKQQIESCIQQIPPNWDPHTRLEFVKTMIRSKTLELRLMNKRYSSSEAIKERLNILLNKPIFTGADIPNIEALKLELANAEEQEAERYKIMAGVKWREAGEKSTRYFLNRFKPELVLRPCTSLT